MAVGLVHGHGDTKRRAVADFGLHVDGAVVLLDDPVRQRQPQSRTLAYRLGGVERVEDAGQYVLGDACPGVAY